MDRIGTNMTAQDWNMSTMIDTIRRVRETHQVQDVVVRFTHPTNWAVCIMDQVETNVE